jgi:hypothetical protein
VLSSPSHVIGASAQMPLAHAPPVHWLKSLHAAPFASGG